MPITDAEVIEAIRNHLEGRGVDASSISADADLMSDLGLDSLDAVELALGLEERFEIEIPEEDMEGVETVKGVIEIVQKKTSVKA